MSPFILIIQYIRQFSLLLERQFVDEQGYCEMTGAIFVIDSTKTAIPDDILRPLVFHQEFRHIFIAKCPV